MEGITLTKGTPRIVKPREHLDRAARPEDSTQRTRPTACIVEGVAVETITSLDDLLKASFINEKDKIDDGRYLVEKGTVRAEIVDDGSHVKLHTITTRPSHPVIFGLEFYRLESGALMLVRGYANHRNPELDSQVVNNPVMLTFALSKVYEEVRLNKDPTWWLDTLRAYDQRAGTNYAQAHIDKFHGGIDPRELVVSASALESHI